MFLTVPSSYSSIIDIGTLHESEALKSKIRNFAAAVLLSLQQETQLIYEHPWPCQPQRMSRLPCHPPRYDASIRMRTKSYWADPQQPLVRRHPGSRISKIRHWYTLIQETQEATTTAQYNRPCSVQIQNNTWWRKACYVVSAKFVSYVLWSISIFVNSNNNSLEIYIISYCYKRFLEFTLIQWRLIYIYP